MPKKSNTKRSDGRIAVQIYLGKDENGKRKYKTVYGATQKEANKKADEIRAMLGKGLDVLQEQVTFKEWAELFLASQKKVLSESCFNLKKKRIEYFYTYIGVTAINSVKVFQIEEALGNLAETNPLTGRATAGATLKNYKQVCSQVFKFAIKNRATEFNPAEFAELPKGTVKSQRRALSETEREWILKLSSEHRAKRPAMIAMLCGLRRGELTALTWDDISFSERNITVNKSFDFKTGKIKLPKSVSGIRKVPIPQILLDFLRTEKRTSIYVCPSAHNTMMSDTAWRRLLESLLDSLELEHGTHRKNNKHSPFPTVRTVEPFGWHELRHTYATTLFEAGVDVLTAQYLLGHSSPETTMNIYTHLSEAQKSRSIVKLNDFLSKKDVCKSDTSQVI